ncbi:MAG: DciA family protein [Pelagibacterales bacterium]|jgi:hypothetical protein|nr:DciA family protein [Pelagibacterales bacterium]|tara:strand:- start:733 stop:1200 length:468 start_codon:yes stop_codon:yes gene_type:complete
MSNKKYSGLRSVSNFFPKEVKSLLRKRGFFELELLKNWINIVDKKYINTSLPIKLKSGKSNNGANLVVKVDPSNAFGFEHDKDIIKRKINSYFGYNAVEKITIIQDRFATNDIENNNNNKLDKLPKKQSKSFNQLENHPRLKEAFEKISKKISKT